jgi:uncharacterized membrane protein
MSKDVLEKALNRTVEIEQKNQKQQRIAESIGKILGLSAAITFDALIIWTLLNWLVGFSVGYLPVLGVSILVQMTLAKIKITLK